MARKPNYRFERSERDRAKAAKKAAKAAKNRQTKNEDGSPNDDPHLDPLDGGGKPESD